MLTAFAVAEENLASQSFDFPAVSRGPSDVVVKSNGMASACQAWARWLASSQASCAVIDAGFPVLPAVQLGIACAPEMAAATQSRTKADPKAIRFIVRSDPAAGARLAP